MDIKEIVAKIGEIEVEINKLKAEQTHKPDLKVGLQAAIDRRVENLQHLRDLLAKRLK